MIKYEELSERGKFCVDKFNKLVSSKLDKKNYNIIYQLDEDNWIPSDIFIGDRQHILQYKDKPLLKRAFPLSYFIDPGVTIPLKCSDYFKFLGIEYFGEKFNLISSKNNDIYLAFLFVRQQNMFCPNIKNPWIFNQNRMFAFDESFFNS